jgi:hypothetical protein
MHQSRTLLAWLVACFLLPAPAAADFLRGDSSLDGKVDLTDAIVTLRFLLLGGSLVCDDAADASDDGTLNLEDAIDVLNALFRGGILPSPGAFVPGADPTCDRLGCALAPSATPAILLSEIQYNPGASQLTEYIELHNRTAEPVSLRGYRFTDGLTFAFPDDATIPAGGFVLVLNDPNNARWRRFDAIKHGPFEGSLADGGERLTLAHDDCLAESVKYNDRAPWSIAADGAGPPLERLSYLEPADDHHSWRAATARTGSPAAANTVLGTPARPLIDDYSFEPPQPRSSDAVKAVIRLDAPAAAIARVTLTWESVAVALSTPTALELPIAASGADWSLVEATLPPLPSQTLVRMNLQVELADGRTTVLPHPAEPKAALSYFVYDGEMPTKLPLIWIFPKKRTGLPGAVRSISGVVILEPEGSVPSEARGPLVFDSADVRTSRQGMKVKFLKGEEFRDDRTINIAPEEGGGGTGLNAPHMEHMGFLTFRELGGLAPWAEWFRVVDNGGGARRHQQRLVYEQVNERFLEKNGLNPDGDLYKYVYQGLEKHTNVDAGMVDFNQLLVRLRSANVQVRHDAVMDELDLASVGFYSVAGTLMANWDGFHNNVWIYNDLSPEGRWKAIPWDLDQVFEIACAQMPITRPLTGEGCNSREPGVLSRPYHLEAELHEAYKEALRAQIAPGGLFTLEMVLARLETFEKLLNEDLDLQEAYLGATRTARRTQIRSAYGGMRTYAQARIRYLEGVLGQ